jgi:two-component system NarL family sensor kinase
MLNVASVDWRELSDDDLRLLYTVGDLLSIAVERARLFARRIEFGAAEERNRIAREIHDTLAQGLAAIALQLETSDALLEAGSNIERARQAVQHALGLARTNLEEARRSVLDLRAAPLEGRTLAEAITQLAEEYAIKGKLRLELDVNGENRPLPQRIEGGLYRMAQEALTNIIRHARAARMTVQLTTTPEQIKLIVEDDGLGFEPSEVPRGRYGLIGLNERAKLLGGTLELCSSPGEGTWVEVTVPLKDNL